VLKIHTSDGQTHKVDLFSEEQANTLLKSLNRHDFQRTIKGVSLVEKHKTGRCKHCGGVNPREIGVQYSISRPEFFRNISFDVESNDYSNNKGCEKIIIFADDIRLVLTAHKSQPATRIVVSKIGKQKYKPY